MDDHGIEKTISVGWSVTLAAYRGASNAHKAAFSSYLDSWCDLNKFVPVEEPMFHVEQQGPMVIISATMSGVTQGEPKQRKKAAPRQPKPGVPVQLPDAPEEAALPEGIQHWWVNVAELVPGDEVISSNKLDTVIAVAETQDGMIHIDFANRGNIVYAKKDRLKKRI